MENQSERVAPDRQRSRLPYVVGLLLVIAAALVIYSCYKPGQSERQLPVVKLNIVTWPGYGPIYLAQEKGFFREEGVEVDCQIQENTQARNAALVSGQVDLIGNTLESIVLANAEGIPMQVVGLTDISDGGDGIIVAPGIDSIQGLKGKRVAFPEGQPSHLFLLYHLDKAGMSASDVKPVYTDDAGKAGEIFAAGQVDAAVTWEPWLSRVTESKKGRVLVNSKGVQDILIGVLAANRNNVASNSDKLRRFMRGWYRGLEYAKAHREESIPIMAKGFQLPPGEFSDILQGLRFLDRGEVERLLGGGGAQGDLLRIVVYEEGLWRKAGVSKQQIDPASIYTGNIVHAAR
jgi:NitT/TauT family transport system substrate-binding protein